jgi:hypothetical protein
LLTVLVGILTNVVVNGLISVGPGDAGFPFSLPKNCLTPTSPGLTMTQELATAAINTNTNIFFISLIFS